MESLDNHQCFLVLSRWKSLWSLEGTDDDLEHSVVSVMRSVGCMEIWLFALFLLQWQIIGILFPS